MTRQTGTHSSPPSIDCAFFWGVGWMWMSCMQAASVVGRLCTPRNTSRPGQPVGSSRGSRTPRTCTRHLPRWRGSTPPRSTTPPARTRSTGTTCPGRCGPWRRAALTAGPGPSSCTSALATPSGSPPRALSVYLSLSLYIFCRCLSLLFSHSLSPSLSFWRASAPLATSCDRCYECTAPVRRRDSPPRL